MIFCKEIGHGPGRAAVTVANTVAELACELTNIESQGFHRAVGFEEANRLVAYVRKL